MMIAYSTRSISVFYPTFFFTLP